MIRSAVLFSLAALASLSCLPARALAQAEPSRGVALFPRQASVTEPSASGQLLRLPLPPDVLAEARADLGDVRLHDAYGEEVAYAIDRGLAYPSSRTTTTRAVVPYDATEETTRSAAGVISTRESYHLRPPAPPTYGGTWELVLEVETPELLRRIVVRAEPPFGEPREVHSGAVFRFPAHGNHRLSVPLPGVADEPIVVELSGEGRALHPRFVLREIDRTITEPARVAVPLAIRETRREGTRTVLVVDRPSGFPTEAISVTSSTASFSRALEVGSVAPGGMRVVLGRGGLLRVAGLDAPELLTVRLDAGGGDTLEIAIEDGDSPPLADLAVKAEVRVPSLLFDPGRARFLRWGGSRARAPRYDLMTMDLAGLVRGRELATAILGTPEPNPEHDDTPALAFAMRAGQPVALERHTHRAPLTVTDARDGLSRFRVPPELWAAAREDLADLRVVDAEGRQWPYLLSPAAGTDELASRVARGTPTEDDGHRTRHEVSLSARAVSPMIVRIELPPQLVSRRVVAHGTRPDGQDAVLGEVSFVTSADTPARVEVPLFGERVVALWLEVDNGDEAPLAIEEVIVVQQAHEIQLVAPAGEYGVVVGDLDAEAPSYDLYRAEALLALLEADDAELGPLAENPAYHEPTFFERSGWETIVLTGVLGLVVLVLFVLTLRIARAEPTPPPTSTTQSPPATAPAQAPPRAAEAAPAPAPEGQGEPSPTPPPSPPDREPEAD